MSRISKPDVPTLIEQGFPGITAFAWWGILAPTGVPKPIMERFHAELVKVLALPDVKKILSESLAMEPVVSNPERLQQFIIEEMNRWGRIVKDNDIRVD